MEKASRPPESVLEGPLKLAARNGVQNALEEVLAIEREASAIVERARAEARAVRTRAGQAAEAVRREVLDQARRQAEESVAAARAEAERERQQRLAHTTREAEGLGRSARRHLDAAVHLVVGRVLGKSSAEVGVREAPAPTARRVA